MIKYTVSVRPFRARLQVGLVMALIFSNTLFLAFPHTAFAQFARSHSDLEAKGKHLQVSLDAQYKDLNSKRALKKTNDVTSLVLQDASPSMSIEDLTHVLRSAGFREPGTAPNGQMVFSMPIGGSLSLEQVVVVITPKSRGDFHVIQSVTGTLLPATP